MGWKVDAAANVKCGLAIAQQPQAVLSSNIVEPLPSKAEGHMESDNTLRSTSCVAHTVGGAAACPCVHILTRCNAASLKAVQPKPIEAVAAATVAEHQQIPRQTMSHSTA